MILMRLSISMGFVFVTAGSLSALSPQPLCKGNEKMAFMAAE
jgi:hypothetical protein